MGSPMNGMMYAHKAIRKELETLERASVDLASAPGEEIDRFSERFAFLSAALRGHQEGEEEVLWPALEEKFPHVVVAYTLDHTAEKAAFGRIEELLAELVRAEGQRRVEVGTGLRLEMGILRAAVSHHSRKEDGHIVPLVTGNFSLQEQGDLAARSMTHLPSELMPRLMPWVVDAISPEERADLVGTIARTMPPEPFRATVGWIKGGIPQGDWEDLVYRVPELAAA